MKLFKWQPGRQGNCNYQKFPMWFFRIGKLGFDAYILKYEADQVLPTHTDPVEGGNHYRLNIGWGVANFLCAKTMVAKRLGRLSLYIFRPDLYPHSLFVFGPTTKLSFGFVKYA
jgi:hypothetical protein